MATATARKAREFTFSEKDFEQLRELVYRHTGIRMADNRRDLIYGRLSRRLRALGLTNFSDYCRFIDEGDDPEELEAFRNAVTTNLTAFFRESHHFEYLADELLPQLARQKGAERKLRFWSAGCSSGEEPYTIAMVLREAIPDIHSWDVSVLATDLDSAILQKGREGVYDVQAIQRVLGPRLKRWFLRGTGPYKGKARVKNELRELVDFQKMNLMEPWPWKKPFDAIFCRNVLIYFDKPTQRKLFERFASVLPLRGHLFIGHSESPMDLTDRFELIGKSVYRRVK